MKIKKTFTEFKVEIEVEEEDNELCDPTCRYCYYADLSGECFLFGEILKNNLIKTDTETYVVGCYRCPQCLEEFKAVAADEN